MPFSNFGLIRQLQQDAKMKSDAEGVHRLAKNMETRLEELQLIADLEKAHKEADEILCELLTKIGFKDLVSEYEAIEKYYG